MGGDIPLWTPENGNPKKFRPYQNLCIASVFLAFGIGLLVGVLIPTVLSAKEENFDNSTSNLDTLTFKLRPEMAQKYIAPGNDTFAAVKFVEDDGIVEDGIFWGRKVEDVLPKGFASKDNDNWVNYVSKSVAVRLEQGCGRMQNRLVTFQDGTKGCVRYRQNLDQIQGEVFSFYLAQLLQLSNLAPSTVSLIDLQSVTWKNLPNEVAGAQWNSNRPVVVTKFIPDLGSANIPEGFRPPDQHLTQKYVLERNTSTAEQLAEFAELAQWSDLVIFDYLTANLDRVVNNLYNRQWNANIMEAPAHNLARRSDSLLVFLDNESGLLHGYRLLHKYEPYHSLLLDNLCVFRKQTVTALERLRRDRNVGKLLVKLFEEKTGSKIRDVLPSLPEKSVKVLNERLDRVHGQIARCRRNIFRGL